MKAIQTSTGAVTALEAADLKSACADAGLEWNADWNEITAITNHRIEQRLKTSPTDAVRFGTFSYLIEGLRSLTGPQDCARRCAVEIAEAFLGANPGIWKISNDELAHFAEVIQSNAYDWEGFSIAFLDPEAARLDRLRQNLRLTPSERWRRHKKLISQIKRVRRAAG